MHNQLTAWLTVAEQAARAGGEQLLHWRSRFSVSEKGRFDLVTDADHASQAAIREVILSQCPDHHFLGEETPAAERATLLHTKEPLWVVDPLDGTTNYVHDLPCYAVSIGLVIDEWVQLGVIYDPVRDELFSAAKDQGAFLSQAGNGKHRTPIRCSTTASLKDALIAVGFPALLRGKEYVIEAWKQFGYESQGLRRTGSSAMNLAYLASGRVDAFFAYQICPWDIAAGIILVEEAGGTISQQNGQPYHPLSETVFVASNGPLHSIVLQTLSTIAPGAPR